MVNLLTVDFRRVLKDKLLMVMGILAVAFSLFNGLILGVTASIMDEESLMLLESLGMGMNATSQFFGAFSFGNNVGLIAPVLLAIILCKDFGSGTIRNKVIAGYSRVSILMSLFIVCLVVMFGVMLLYALLTMGISLIFMPFATVELTWEYVGYFLTSLLLELLIYVLAAALITYLCASKKNVGLVIVLYVAVVLVLSLLAGILQGVSMALDLTGGGETAREVIDFFQSINVFNYATSIGQGTAYEGKELARYILVPFVTALLLLGWGILRFRKKDLK